MKIAVVSSSPVIRMGNHWHAYAPYAKELDIWGKSGQLIFVCPIRPVAGTLLVTKINSVPVAVLNVKEFNFKTVSATFQAIKYSLFNIAQIFRGMRSADHIHLRCPGNVGLLGCIVQMFFPDKPKSAKYAGNWDPEADQPWSYRLQRWILANTFLTKNMQVLVYGNWPDQSRNIKPFFTATYNENDKTEVTPRSFDDVVRFLFVGTLSPGKQPVKAIEIAAALREKGVNAHLDIFGNGTLMADLKAYISNHDYSHFIKLHGNQNESEIRTAYQLSHFLVLPSKSEGWPKVVAEAMFWGCVPACTRISCVPDMLGCGERGILLTNDLTLDVDAILVLIKNPSKYHEMSLKSADWSRKYTKDFFEAEVGKIVNASI